MKKIFTLFLCIFSLSCFASSNITHYSLHACSIAPPTTDPTFCSAFKKIAQCHCQEDGHLPAGMCQDMNTIYSRMIATFGSQDAACRWQKDTPYQECMDDWNCYRLGGKNSAGGLCSGTGAKCP
jgi:hypothetical protein